MGKENPIIIIGIPRSGTSMVSGIFANHGVWFGKCREPSEENPKGYFENIQISNIIRENKADFQFSKRRVYKILKEEGYERGPWAVKHSVKAVQVWGKFNPKIICCKRNAVANFKSYRKSMKEIKGTVTFDRFRKIYRENHQLMNETNGIFVCTDDIIKGDYSSLKKAFDYCGIEFIPEIADSFIEPKFWHYD